MPLAANCLAVSIHDSRSLDAAKGYVPNYLFHSITEFGKGFQRNLVSVLHELNDPLRSLTREKLQDLLLGKAIKPLAAVIHIGDNPIQIAVNRSKLEKHAQPAYVACPKMQPEHVNRLATTTEAQADITVIVSPSQFAQWQTSEGGNRRQILHLQLAKAVTMWLRLAAQNIVRAEWVA